MSGGILTRPMNGSKFVPISDGTEIELTAMQYGAAKFWAEHSQPSKGQYLDEVFPKATNAAAVMIMSLKNAGVITVDDDGRVFMADMTRAALLGEV